VQLQGIGLAGDIISKQTRAAFREHFVGWTLATIATEFDSADVRCDSDYQPPCSGARRSLVEQYYRAVDFTEWKDVRKILRVYEAVLAKLEEANPFAYLLGPPRDH
jgi:hypothetical protein